MCYTGKTSYTEKSEVKWGTNSMSSQDLPTLNNEDIDGRSGFTGTSLMHTDLRTCSLLEKGYKVTL